MLILTLTGAPPALGLQHGQGAKTHILRSITFYQGLFLQKSNMDWETVRSFALKYQPYLETAFPQYVSEMRGVAEGAGVAYEDILALNVRTEIAFGSFSDGCTALSWKRGEKSLLAQNWDWDVNQAENIVCLKIEHENGARFQLITEAGIIGKIGLNSKGVGCTLNAIKAKGVSFSKLPCHLALRTVLESESREAAIAVLEKEGVASACHILVADVTGGTGLECSSEDIVRLEMSKEGIVTHTNHYVLEHKPSVTEAKDWLIDTKFRLRRIDYLLNVAKKEQPNLETVESFLKDETEGDGACICRIAKRDSLATLFSIVMDLGIRSARVVEGRPVNPLSELNLTLQ